MFIILLLILFILILVLLIYIHNFLKFTKHDSFLNNKIKTIKANDFFVPKKIHQIWFQGYDNLHTEVKNVIEHNLKINPEWEHVFWDSKRIDDFIKNNESDYVYRAYNKINPVFKAMKADLARYIILYHIGGVYIDIKIKILNTLDKWIDNTKLNLTNWYIKHPILYLYTNNIKNVKNLKIGYEFAQMALIFPKNHDILRILIDDVCHNIYNFKKTFLIDKLYGHRYYILSVTGPIAYTKILSFYIKNNPDKIKFYKSLQRPYIYDFNMILDGTNGYYYKYQNNRKDNHYGSNKFKNEKIII